MSSAISPVATKALKLGPVQRMGLATLLLDSLETEDGVEKKVLRELTRRCGTEERKG
jgi:hypothetical protein